MTDFDPERPLSANLFCTAKIYSFDQFVRAQQESLGDGEADGLCGLDVNRQLELGRELHRQLAYLGAAQDAVDVRCGPAIPIKLICCVCQKPARGDVGPTGVDRGQPVLCRQRDDRLASGGGVRGWQHKKAAIRRSRERVDRAYNVDRIANRHLDNLYAETWRRRFDQRHIDRGGRRQVWIERGEQPP